MYISGIEQFPFLRRHVVRSVKLELGAWIGSEKALPRHGRFWKQNNFAPFFRHKHLVRIESILLRQSDSLRPSVLKNLRDVHRHNINLQMIYITCICHSKGFSQAKSALRSRGTGDTAFSPAAFVNMCMNISNQGR